MRTTGIHVALLEYLKKNRENAQSKIVTDLLEAFVQEPEKYDINLTLDDYNGQTLLHIALRADCPLEVIEAFLQIKEIDVNAKDQNGVTPLHFSVINKSDNITKRLLDNGAHDHLTKMGTNSVIIAVKYKQYADLEELLLRGYDYLRSDRMGLTPLELAIQNKDIQSIEILSLFGAFLDKEISADLLTFNLRPNLNYHFLLETKFVEHQNESTKFHPIKDENFPLAIINIERLKTAHRYLRTLRNVHKQVSMGEDIRVFLDSAEQQFAAYSILLSSLAIRWSSVLKLSTKDQKNCLDLYKTLCEILNFKVQFVKTNKVENPKEEVLDSAEEQVAKNKAIEITEEDRKKMDAVLSRFSEELLDELTYLPVDEFVKALTDSEEAEKKNQKIILELKKFRKIDRLEDMYLQFIAKQLYINPSYYDEVKKIVNKDLLEKLIETENTLKISNTIDASLNNTLYLLKKFRTQILNYIQMLESRSISRFYFIALGMSISFSLCAVCVLSFMSLRGGTGLAAILLGLFIIFCIISLISTVFIPIFSINNPNCVFLESIEKNIYKYKKVNNLGEDVVATKDAIISVLTHCASLIDYNDIIQDSLIEILEKISQPSIKVRDFIQELYKLNEIIDQMIKDVETILLERGSKKNNNNNNGKMEEGVEGDNEVIENNQDTETLFLLPDYYRHVSLFKINEKPFGIDLIPKDIKLTSLKHDQVVVNMERNSNTDADEKVNLLP